MDLIDKKSPQIERKVDVNNSIITDLKMPIGFTFDVMPMTYQGKIFKFNTTVDRLFNIRFFHKQYFSNGSNYKSYPTKECRIKAFG